MIHMTPPPWIRHWLKETFLLGVLETSGPGLAEAAAPGLVKAAWRGRLVLDWRRQPKPDWWGVGDWAGSIGDGLVMSGGGGWGLGRY